MKKTLVTALGLAGWVASAACSGTDHPPAGGLITNHDGGGDDAAGSSSGATQGDGSSSEDGEADGAPSDAGARSDVVSVTPPSDSSMPEPTCSPNQTWGQGTATAGLPSFNTQPLITVTNDELTVAWVVQNGDQGTVYVADRTSTTNPFGSPNVVTGLTLGGSTVYVDGAAFTDGGDAYFAFDRVALSDDGLTLIGVAVGGMHLAEFTRTSRTQPFYTTSSESRYEDLSSTLMTGQMLGDPVLGSSNEDLVYSQYGRGASITVYESFRSSVGMAWLAGSGLGNAVLAANDAGDRKRPTSMTADWLTLFVWDEAGQAYAIPRPGPSLHFGGIAIPFGDRFSIQVNGSCSRIYYVSAGAAPYTVQQADAL